VRIPPLPPAESDTRFSEGDLGVHLWLVRKRVVDFLLVLIELFSPALMVEAQGNNTIISAFGRVALVFRCADNLRVFGR